MAPPRGGEAYGLLNEYGLYLTLDTSPSDDYHFATCKDPLDPSVPPSRQQAFLINGNPPRPGIVVRFSPIKNLTSELVAERGHNGGYTVKLRTFGVRPDEEM
jgi:hypothetical protein